MIRMRSPNFPGIPLEQAIKLVEVIFKSNRQNVISRAAAAKDLGYTGLTGRTMKLLGALNQYDLVANTSKGEMRVTQTAVDILHSIDPADKIAALQKAGRAPALFKSIFEKFKDGIPSENAVRSFLITNGFTDKGVDRALKSFLETNRFLELNGVSESYGDEPESEAESAPDNINQEQHDVNTPEVKSPPTDFKDPAAIFCNKGVLDFSLSSGGLVVAGATNSATELKAYIGKLTALLALLPENDEKSDE